jgi:hypothetical protein
MRLGNADREGCFVQDMRAGRAALPFGQTNGTQTLRRRTGAYPARGSRAPCRGVGGGLRCLKKVCSPGLQGGR